jgi:hypothetical protein
MCVPGRVVDMRVGVLDTENGGDCAGRTLVMLVGGDAAGERLYCICRVVKFPWS